MNSRLDNIEQRLLAALTRIDSAVSATADEGGPDDALQALSAENAALRNKQREISAKLDAAIERLQRVLKD